VRGAQRAQRQQRLVGARHNAQLAIYIYICANGYNKSKRQWSNEWCGLLATHQLLRKRAIGSLRGIGARRADGSTTGGGGRSCPRQSMRLQSIQHIFRSLIRLHSSTLDRSAIGGARLNKKKKKTVVLTSPIE
jgi:hypothetical protein